MSLSNLSNAPGVSGNEGAVREIIADIIRDYVDKMWVDALGNLIATKGDHLKGPRVLVCAHMDEVGLMIDHIEDNGRLKFSKVGGIDDRVLPSTYVNIGSNLLSGIIGSKPIHLQSRSERAKPIDIKQMYIDIGARSKSEAEEHVSTGDYASFCTQYESLSDNIAMGKAFDDRVGCFVLTEVLKAKTEIPLIAAFTTQEEIGLRGSSVIGYSTKPDVALVLEGTTCADIPLSPPHGQSTNFGQGAVLTVADSSVITHPKLVKALISTAEGNGIPYQLKRTTFGGTDAGSIQRAETGIPVAVISAPCRYIHTPASLVSLNDVHSVKNLLQHFMENINKKGASLWLN